MEPSAASRPTAKTSITTFPTAPIHMAPSIPNGFIATGVLSNGPGTSAKHAVPTAAAARPARRTGRQRGDGNLPVGYTSGIANATV
jgi:hypothetical protein